MKDINKFLTKYFEKRQSEFDLQNVQILKKFNIPNDYTTFLAKFECNNEVFIGNECFEFWNAENLTENNNEYEIQENIPNCLAIGSNLSGEFIGIDFENNSKIILCPFIGLDKTDFMKVADNLFEFFNNLENGKNWFE